MANDTTIRPATQADAPAILALTRAAYAKWVPVIGREPKPMGADYEHAVRKHQFALLYVGHELAALIEMIPEAEYLLIENVAVSPEHQGKGLARQLLTYAEELAKARGYDEVRLYTNQKFEENVRIYLRFGYEIYREEIVPGRGVAVHMRKPIGR